MFASTILLLATCNTNAFQWPSLASSTSDVSVFATRGKNGSTRKEDARSTCPQRRHFLSRVAISSAGLSSSLMIPPSKPYCHCCVNALVDFAPPPSKLVDAYDPQRNQFMDSLFSWNMATTMDEYEEEAAPYKTQLFQTLFDSLTRDKGHDVPVIVEVGMGTFPNAPHFARSKQSSKFKGLDIIGVDPNDSMKQYAFKSAKKSELLSPDVSLRVVHGVAEALPFADGSVDAVVTTLTLCSVANPERAVSEIKRILKPGKGKFLFWEHVLSESDAVLALQQQILSPLQTLAADGCHLNRRTGKIIGDAGFDGGVDLKHTIMKSANIIGPTVYGIASL